MFTQFFYLLVNKDITDKTQKILIVAQSGFIIYKYNKLEIFILNNGYIFRPHKGKFGITQC